MNDVLNMPLILPFDAIDRTMLAEVGGKGANLGELVKAGFLVPPGFCVTTAAYGMVAKETDLEPVLAALDHAHKGKVPPPGALAAAARAAILAAPLPDEIATAVTAAYKGLAGDGGMVPMAVRSSATAEDLPDASFAGQQETYLNIVGTQAVLEAVRQCWASLWTDRAVAYRAQEGLNQRAVQLAVVVQQMIPSVVSGVLFTANPLTNRRQEAVIDAIPGLGEALVSGMANPDHWVIDRATMHITQRHVNEPGVVIRPKAGGGTEQIRLPAEKGRLPALTDRSVLELARLGAQVEAHYGRPQDIEWALDEAGTLWLVQTRPITTLFPVPKPQPVNDTVHAYFSFNIAQGVLGPLTPMGLDLFRQLATGVAGLLRLPPDPARASHILTEAGYRGYIDVTAVLHSPVGRRLLRGLLRVGEPRTGDALEVLLTDARFAPGGLKSTWHGLRRVLRMAVRMHVPERVLLAFVRPDWGRQVAQGRAEAFLAEAARPCAEPAAALERAVALLTSAPERMVLPLIGLALLPGLASFELARRLAADAGRDDRMSMVTRGLPYDVTTTMNLDLWQVATKLRADSAANKALGQQTPQELAALYQRTSLPPVLQEGVRGFLERYGARGVAEIDVGLPRWRDDPMHVLGVLANYVRLTGADAAPDIQFRRAQVEAKTAMAQMGEAVRHDGAFGPLRALVLGWLLQRVRALVGMRESPKFFLVRLLGRSRELLEQAGAGLVQVGRLEQADDIFFLHIAEAREAFAGQDQRS